MTPIVVTLVGNPKPQSRTYQVAARLSQTFCTALQTASSELWDLADIQDELFCPESARRNAVLTSCRQATVLIVASPTFKASYTGLLKSFLDWMPYNGLQGILAIPLMTGAAPQHALAVEWHLRPLLTELGALVIDP
ncbi:MAG: NAD(P)H-dependent oxidoreductase, partial [Firmicutes bacterium]|nr:NAD(P)H-dependent oxidoreductase [Bacillota bacterium]